MDSCDVVLFAHIATQFLSWKHESHRLYTVDNIVDYYCYNKKNNEEIMNIIIMFIMNISNA